jgi:hypothetical protein
MAVNQTGCTRKAEQSIQIATFYRGQRFASTAATAPMTEAFVRNIEEFVRREAVDLVTSEKSPRKDDVTQQYLRDFEGTEGVLYVGKAQEKVRIMRTERRRSRTTGGTFPWIVKSTADRVAR